MSDFEQTGAQIIELASHLIETRLGIAADADLVLQVLMTDPDLAQLMTDSADSATPQLMDSLSRYLLGHPLPSEPAHLSDAERQLQLRLATWSAATSSSTEAAEVSTESMTLAEQLVHIFRTDVGAVPSSRLLEQTLLTDEVLMDDAAGYGFLNPNVRERTVDCISYALLGQPLPAVESAQYRSFRQSLANRIIAFG